ncbi:hypothetical protein JOM56_004615 [Amanita muscaria]
MSMTLLSTELITTTWKNESFYYEVCLIVSQFGRKPVPFKESSTSTTSCDRASPSFAPMIYPLGGVAGIVMATVTQDLPFSPSPALRARPDCKKLVLLGEIGGIEKYRVIDVVEKVIMKKPIAQALVFYMQSSHEISTPTNSHNLDEFSVYLGKVTQTYPELAKLVLAAFGPPSVADLVGLCGYLKALGTVPHDPYSVCEPVPIRDFGTWKSEYACGYMEGFPYYMRPLSLHLPGMVREEITSQLKPGLRHEGVLPLTVTCAVIDLYTEIEDFRYADDLTARILTAMRNRTLRVNLEGTN